MSDDRKPNILFISNNILYDNALIIMMMTMRRRRGRMLLLLLLLMMMMMMMTITLNASFISSCISSVLNLFDINKRNSANSIEPLPVTRNMFVNVHVCARACLGTYIIAS